ncbi:MAG: L,D-transpeptidase family protein [Clostridium sp.]|uniref:L,D-transpeptidase family protein n=1 Tax=Clostridium sp. TaxID=1506 RepID=UPI003D6D9584
MNKTYLSCILFIFIIALSGCTLPGKESVATKLPPIGAKVYQQNTSYTINENEVIKNVVINNVVSTKKQQVVKTSFKLGDKGSKVKEIQVKLNKFGYNLHLDSDFGKLTYYAVMDFQTRNKIVKDGIVGASTLKKMDLYPTPATMYKAPIYRKPEIQKPITKATTSTSVLENLVNSRNLSSSTTYFVWIDLPKQKVNIFKGSNKKWKLVKSMSCSTGKTSTPTVKGKFTVGSKGSYFISSGGARCKYYTQISGNYLFHSVLYDRKGNYIIDNTLGVPVSHGCVRLALSNAKFIYDNIPARTLIWSK